MGKKILKLEFNGNDFGYVKMIKNHDAFYGDGSEAEAVEFELVNYHGSETQFYFKVAGTNSYLDFSFSSSVIKVTTPWFSVDASSVCAWELIDKELHAILSDTDTTKAISRSKADPLSKALYANSPIDGNHCKVEIVDATAKSKNEVKAELQHALV
ncbi:hypothetical protein ACW5XW_11810 [Aeromonas piscicola]|uniref:hypothetical protein n=1 Tax=Aeromonas piscicola TaxID=600645 RepID=UPI0005B355B4|nr:hypothetical protein [Aeromonas piscicola]